MKIPEENHLKLLFVHIIVLKVIKIVFLNDYLVMEPWITHLQSGRVPKHFQKHFSYE